MTSIKSLILVSDNFIQIFGRPKPSVQVVLTQSSQSSINHNDSNINWRHYLFHVMQKKKFIITQPSYLRGMCLSNKRTRKICSSSIHLTKSHSGPKSHVFCVGWYQIRVYLVFAYTKIDLWVPLYVCVCVCVNVCLLTSVRKCQRLIFAANAYCTTNVCGCVCIFCLLW